MTTLPPLQRLPGDLVRHLASFYHPSRSHHLVLREVSKKWSQYLPLKKKDKNLPTLFLTWGSLPLLQWSLTRKYPLPNDLCALAAGGGHLEVLRWARENGCPWDEYTCSWAAKGGHLEVLRWARENGCPWSLWTCALAAEGGHLEVLRWARENGCPEN